MEDQAVSMLSQLLRCHYESLGSFSANSFMVSFVPPLAKFFLTPDNNLMDKIIKDKWIMENNIRLTSLCENEKELCQNSTFLSDICKAFPVQTIKTVRVRLDVIPKLLGDEE